MLLEQFILEREVERDPVGDPLAREPLVGLLDRLAERAARSPADVARELVDAEHDAVVPVVQVRRELLHQVGELVALADRHLLHALLGLRGADVDVRAGGSGETELEATVPHVVDDVGGHEHLACLRADHVRADHISEGVDVALVGEVLTAAEVVALPERDRLSHHVAQRLGLVVDVADLAERGPAPEHEDRPSLQQPDEHPLLPVGHDVARAHHHRERDRRRREPRRRELLEQPILTEQLVEPVLDLLRAAVDRRLLRDRQQRRPRVDHGGADEHVVTDPPPEQIDHRARRLRGGTRTCRARSRTPRRPSTSAMRSRSVRSAVMRRMPSGNGASVRPRLSTVTS